MIDIPALLREVLCNSRFFVGIELDGSKATIDGYFMECQGFKQTQEVIEIAEVSPNSFGKSSKGRVLRTKIPGNLKTDNIVLRRGMSLSMTMWNWFYRVSEGKWAGENREFISDFTKLQKLSKANAMSTLKSSTVGNDEGLGQRYNGRLVIYDQGGMERARFAFEGAWPISYKIGDLKASGNEFEVEEVELAIDSFVRVDLLEQLKKTATSLMK